MKSLLHNPVPCGLGRLAFRQAISIMTEPQTFNEEAPRLSMDPEFSKKEVRILVLGKSGSGKSTLINTMLGTQKAKQSAGAQPTNHEPIELHREVFGRTTIFAYDTKGLCDPSKQKELLAEIQKECPNGFDLILICYKMSERKDDGLFHSLKMLAGVFGDELWARTIFVLTFANIFVLQKENEDITAIGEVREAIDKEKDCIRDMIRKKLNLAEKVFNSIPFVVAGSKKNFELPTTDNWLIDLWNESVKYCANEARPFLSKVAIYRLVIECVAIGSGIVVGGLIGAAIGSLVLPGVGTITTAATGAKVGACAGGVVGGVAVGIIVGGKRLNDMYKKDVPA